MSREVILTASQISKQYRLGSVGTGTLSHDLNRWWANVRGKEDPYLKIGEENDRTTKGSSDYVWALKNIDFDVYKREVLGIIGKNGAGKSTLLKILSRVTAPTTGSIKTKGRIASLLEVGTGFNGEMTGRENIFLNGAILGMTKKEIKSKIDEIIAFSGCERYIDTPVKRYSSGMTVRLAFAVAAFLEPEILVIDEVLAVGDAEFQKKAIGKMQDISRGEGRTVIFVSHNMAAVKSLCTRGIVMENGKIAFEGGIDQAVNLYLSGGLRVDNQLKSNEVYENSVFKIVEMSVANKNKSLNEPITEDDSIELVTLINIKDGADPERYHVTFHIYSEKGDPLFSFTHLNQNLKLNIGINHLVCTFPTSFFQSGQYFLSFFLVEDKRNAFFVKEDILSFTVIDGLREIGVFMGREPGFIKPQFDWSINYNNAKRI